MNPVQPLTEGIVFGTTAGIGAAIGEQLWSSENTRRATIFVVVFSLLLWFILLNRRAPRIQLR